MTQTAIWWPVQLSRFPGAAPDDRMVAACRPEEIENIVDAALDAISTVFGSRDGIGNTLVEADFVDFRSWPVHEGGRRVPWAMYLVTIEHPDSRLVMDIAARFGTEDAG